MALSFPYTYFQCPCAAELSDSSGSADDAGNVPDDGSFLEEKDFDPRGPRANFSLYPLEHLLYCEDCQEIRCPKCVNEEIVTYYCPNCLFEVPSSSVKSEGTRCTRSCFECPSCTSPLSVTSLEAQPSSFLGVEGTTSGLFVLSCPYCAWNSQEIGIRFEKSNNIYAQLAKIKNGGEQIVKSAQRRVDSEEGKRRPSLPLISGEEEGNQDKPADDLLPSIRFANLRSFYSSEIAESSPAGPLGFSAGDYAYGSPSSLSRIMGLYTGSSFSGAKPKSKQTSMREAANSSEGLAVFDPKSDNVDKLRSVGWEGTTSQPQRAGQLHNHPRFKDELRPVPYLLRTKRSKRCKTCRHILTKPESKISNTRFRIRLVALNYIPSMTMRLLPSATASTPTTATASSASQPTFRPHQSAQFILTLKNPLFEPVRITLATPSHTPGRVSSRITILCPQFEIGANTDVWDEVLGDDTTREPKRRDRAGSTSTVSTVAEAGKVYERGRNWSSVVVEVMPGDLNGDRFGFSKLGDEAPGRDSLMEDEDVLEIPVFVRVEWEADAAHDEASGLAGAPKREDGKEKRELAYWCVLGVGRIVDA